MYRPDYRRSPVPPQFSFDGERRVNGRVHMAIFNLVSGIRRDSAFTISQPATSSAVTFYRAEAP
jgi:hypothetical protein